MRSGGIGRIMGKRCAIIGIRRMLGGRTGIPINILGIGDAGIRLHRRHVRTELVGNCGRVFLGGRFRSAGGYGYLDGIFMGNNLRSIFLGGYIGCRIFGIRNDGGNTAGICRAQIRCRASLYGNDDILGLDQLAAAPGTKAEVGESMQ